MLEESLVIEEKAVTDTALTIRPVVVSDVPVLAHLYNGLGFPTTVELVRERLQETLRVPDHPTHSFLGLLNERAVSLLELHFVFSVYRTQLVGFVTALIVDTAFRRNKYGQQMMNFAFDYAKAKNCAFVDLITGYDRPEAQKFYEAIGMTDKSHRYFRKFF